MSKVLVVGGSYKEQCLSPSHDLIGGSGLRGVRMISQINPSLKVDFLTAIHSDTKEALDGCVNLLKNVSLSPNSMYIDEEAPHFLYQNTIFPPSLSYEAEGQKFDKSMYIEAENALVYGSLEGRPRIKAGKVVYDPQSPHFPDTFTDNGSVADSIAYVLNHKEAMSIANTACIYKAADFLQRTFVKSAAGVCDVVVIKLAHAGCWVITDKSIDSIPAYETACIHSIGSGDVFSAVFFDSWVVLNLDAKTAAMRASKTTALFCNSGEIPTTLDVDLTPLPSVDYQAEVFKKKIYLAAPFFNQAELSLVEFFRHELTTPWTSVFSPFHDVGIGVANEVYEPDIEGLENCDVVVAILNGKDLGTIFEVGYAVKSGKSIVCLCENVPESDLTMIYGSGAKICRDVGSAIYHTLWECLKV